MFAHRPGGDDACIAVGRCPCLRCRLLPADSGIDTCIGMCTNRCVDMCVDMDRTVEVNKLALFGRFFFVCFPTGVGIWDPMLASLLMSLHVASIGGNGNPATTRRCERTCQDHLGALTDFAVRAWVRIVAAQPRTVW